MPRPIALQAIDVDGDGRDELAVAAAAGRVELLGSDDAGRFTSLAAWQSADTSAFQSALEGWVMPDGGVAFGVLDYNSSGVSVLSAELTEQGKFGPRDQAGGNDLVFADFDTDGRLDVAVLSSNQLMVGFGQVSGDPVFGSALLEDRNGPTALESADFNGDGVLDLAVGIYGANRLTVLLGRGGGSFGEPLSTTVSFGTQSLLATDLNRDGHVDLIVGRGEGLDVLLGAGDGRFLSPQVTLGFGAMALAAADLDGDGERQVVVADYASDRVLVLDWRDGGLQARGVVPVADTPRALAVGDFNRDGRTDIAVACDFGNQIEVLFDLGR